MSENVNRKNKLPHVTKLYKYMYLYISRFVKKWIKYLKNIKICVIYTSDATHSVKSLKCN